MSTEKHSPEHLPGPWHIVPGVYDTNPETATEFPHGPEIIAHGQTVAWCQMYCEANARLIAAAPKMLAALKRLVSEANFKTDGHRQPCSCCVCEAKAVIAEAAL
jgi:hypothetical protein